MTVRTNVSLTKDECALLESLTGKPLLSYEMKCVGGNDAWNTVRLHFENCDVDITSKLQVIFEDDKGKSDEFSVLRVRAALPDSPIVPDMPGETQTRCINRTPVEFSIANDRICFFTSGRQDSEIVYTQALLINLGAYYLCIDKEAWFSEILFIKEGNDEISLIHDDSSSLEIDPKEDPFTTIEYESKIVKI